MKKLLTLAVFFSAFASAAFAQVEFEQIKSRTQEKLHVTGFSTIILSDNTKTTSIPAFSNPLSNIFPTTANTFSTTCRSA